MHIIVLCPVYVHAVLMHAVYVQYIIVYYLNYCAYIPRVKSFVKTVFWSISCSALGSRSAGARDGVEIVRMFPLSSAHEKNTACKGRPAGASD